MKWCSQHCPEGARGEGRGLGRAAGKGAGHTERDFAEVRSFSGDGRGNVSVETSC